jgi:hypothetical protein
VSSWHSAGTALPFKVSKKAVVNLKEDFEVHEQMVGKKKKKDLKTNKQMV